MNAIRHIPAACLVAGLLCFCGCESDSIPDTTPPEIHPTNLVAQIGGIFGPSYEVILKDGDSVVYRHNPQTFTTYPGTQHETIRVSEEQWAGFRQALDEAKVWRWQSKYVDPQIYDGTSWKLQVRYSDGSVDSHGRNAYPKKEQFDRFLQGVRDLTGGKNFQ